ncbi:MAG: hypothetical protein VYE50_02955 [Candidatus Thermoplasmatota archaeon]|nr:hypothetical protein [Candidatus Thermoplasmatota archaeon]
MEEIDEKPNRIPKIGDVVNYRDFLGEYPIIFGIKIISSLALIYVIIEFYSYHNPLDSLITKYIRGPIPGFKPDPAVFVLWSFIAGFGLYTFTLFKGKYKFFLFLITIILLVQYITDPALDIQTGEHVIPTRVEIENSEVEGATEWKWKPIRLIYDDIEGTEERIDDAIIRSSNLIFGSIAFLGAFGIWKRKGWAIAGSIALAIILGFLYSPNLCLESSDADFCGYEQKEKEKTWDEYLASGIFIGMGFIIYIELSYAAIKYENYAEQFKPAGLANSLLTDAQKKGVSRTLRTLFVSYLINLGVMLLITFTLAEIVINVNDYVATSEGRIQDSIELQGPYGIVFTSLIFFMLLGFVRMFVGADYDTEDA